MPWPATWSHTDPDKCTKRAEELSSPQGNPLGFLYRFEWDRAGKCMVLYAYPIRKQTACGWKIDVPLKRRYRRTGQLIDTFVPQKSRRKYAAPSIQEAMTSYIARKTIHMEILKNQLENAERAKEAANPKSRHSVLDFINDVGDID